MGTLRPPTEKTIFQNENSNRKYSIREDPFHVHRCLEERLPVLMPSKSSKPKSLKCDCSIIILKSEKQLVLLTLILSATVVNDDRHI